MEVSLCSAKTPPAIAGLSIPSLTIRTESQSCIWHVEPPLLTDASGFSLVRSMKIQVGPYGEPHVVTAELLPQDILIEMARPLLRLETSGQEVAMIVLRDGTEIRFD
jgi:hypothetical protein